MFGLLLGIGVTGVMGSGMIYIILLRKIHKCEKTKEVGIFCPYYLTAIYSMFTEEFLDASSPLYKRVCPSVGPLVCPSVGPSVGLSVTSYFSLVSFTRNQ